MEREMVNKPSEIPGSNGGWVQQLWPQIYGFVYYKVQNREEAEEFTQETFRRVFQKVESGEVEEGKVKAYVMRAAHNLLLDVWRQRARRPASSSVEELKEQGWEPSEPQGAINLEDKMMVEKALQQLSSEHYQVLLLRIIQGWSVAETAKKMKRSPGAIKSLQFRAVQALKEALEKGGYFDD